MSLSLLTWCTTAGTMAWISMWMWSSTTWLGGPWGIPVLWGVLAHAGSTGVTRHILCILLLPAQHYFAERSQRAQAPSVYLCPVSTAVLVGTLCRCQDNALQKL